MPQENMMIYHYSNGGKMNPTAIAIGIKILDNEATLTRSSFERNLFGLSER